MIYALNCRPISCLLIDLFIIRAGKIYGVLARRHSRILDGDLEEGSASFSITAVLPVVESFDLANEIRKQTSGEASHQLTFSHWEVCTVTNINIVFN